MASLCVCRDCYNTAKLEALEWFLAYVGWREWYYAYYCDGDIPGVFAYSGSPGDVGRLLPFEEWQQLQIGERDHAEPKEI